MTTARNRLLLVVLTLATLTLLPTSAEAQHYSTRRLVSDIPGFAVTTDKNLVNAWGIDRSPTGPWWVADNGTGVSTLYNGAGQPFPLAAPLVVTIPAASGTSAPTGLVFNGTMDFAVEPGKPAIFIFVTEGGTIAGWNPQVNPTTAVQVVDNSGKAIYKGATIAQHLGSNLLYAANFFSGQIEVYDSSFHPVDLGSGAFVDSTLPEGFAPFNVRLVGNRIYVAYAKQDAEKKDEVAGAGLGFVDAFTPGGKLIMRLKTGHWLNAPWGITRAPAGFGKFSGKLLIGNFGSGKIAAYNPRTGNFRGLLRNSKGKPIQIDGLWALVFGNGALAGPATTLFFSAGIDDEAHGLFGTIRPTCCGFGVR
ncbi:MAG TPA: TIGR03118 family protein [Clostridia bacterium]|nr:TIGR03118 family protein [Clostridia bacterium]